MIYYQKDGKLLLDDSVVASTGCVAVHYDGWPSKKLRVGISLNGKTQYHLYMDGMQAPNLYPLNMGSGTYTITLYEQYVGKTYRKIGRLKVYMYSSKSEWLLSPNQFVWFEDDSPYVMTARKLCDGVTDMKQKAKLIRGFFGKAFRYDFVKAARVPKDGEVLPDPYWCYQEKAGICQDFASLATAMFRAVGVPARMKIGKLNGSPHAWVSYQTDGEWHLFDPSLAIPSFPAPKNKKRVYTTERIY